MVLQVAFLGRGVLTDGAEKLPWVDVQLHVLFEVAAVGRFVLAVRTVERLGAVMHLPGVTRHLVLIGRQIAAAVALEWSLTCCGDTWSQDMFVSISDYFGERINKH